MWIETAKIEIHTPSKKLEWIIASLNTATATQLCACAGCDGAREHSPAGVEAAIVRRRDHLGNMHRQWTLWITASEYPGGPVQVLHSVLRGCPGEGQHGHNHSQQSVGGILLLIDLGKSLNGEDPPIQGTANCHCALLRLTCTSPIKASLEVAVAMILFTFSMALRKRKYMSSASISNSKMQRSTISQTGTASHAPEQLGARRSLSGKRNLQHQPPRSHHRCFEGLLSSLKRRHGLENQWPRPSSRCRARSRSTENPLQQVPCWLTMAPNSQHMD